MYFVLQLLLQFFLLYILSCRCFYSSSYYIFCPAITLAVLSIIYLVLPLFLQFFLLLYFVLLLFLSVCRARCMEMPASLRLQRYNFFMTYANNLFLCRIFPLSFFHSFILSLFHSFPLSFFHSFTLSLFHSFILSFFHSFILSFFHSFILSFFHSFTLSFFHSFILSILSIMPDVIRLSSFVH